MLAQMHYGRWYPPQLSEHGVAIDQLIDVLHVFMAVLFIGWGIFFIHCLLKFRRRSGHSARYEPVKGKVSKYAEIGIAMFEAFLLVGLSMPVWAKYKNDPPKQDDRLEVRVVAEQFQWDFHYPGKDGKFGKTENSRISASNPLGVVGLDDESLDPAGADDFVTVNEFHIPVAKPIYVRLTTKDVIHSFDIPTMRVKQDAIPGMEIPIWFTVQHEATTDKIKEAMTQKFVTAKASWYRLRHHVAAEDHKSSGGEILLAKGEDLGAEFKAGDEKLAKLAKAGISELTMQPRNPLEVVCAQLCGNSHFKMKAQMYTHDEAGYNAWVEEKSKKVEFEADF